MHRKDLTLLLATQMQRYPHVMPGPCQACPSWQGHGLRPQDPAVQLSSSPEEWDGKLALSATSRCQNAGSKSQAGRELATLRQWHVCSARHVWPQCPRNQQRVTAWGAGRRVGPAQPMAGKMALPGSIPSGQGAAQAGRVCMGQKALKSITDEGYRARGRIPQGDGDAEHSSSRVTNRLEGRGGQAGPWGGTGMAGCRT